MLFNSYEFIFLFLPITWLGFIGIGGLEHHRVAMTWLVGASLFFYGWWNPAYLGLILASILFNYAIGVVLPNASFPNMRRKALLVVGISANLGLLGYFKYANFFLDNLNRIVDTGIHIHPVILPLAISFFTFQQIAYLVDAFRGETREYNFLHYCLFVTFFPQLIAGPIVHHREMLSQFSNNRIYRFNSSHLAVGLTIFFLGLFKKMVLADGIALYSSPVFSAAEVGSELSFLEAWGGALSYTFQLYFDFSGYSDMAIGAARIFGIRLPVNFASPYKTTSIIDFWRCWHITLSRFLKDYLYLPLGGNRKGRVRRYINLMITMILGGFWHGAGWTFIIWGALHGLYLCINHGWRAITSSIFSGSLPGPAWIRQFLARLLTFLAVVVAWVFFRAESIDGALTILKGMAGLHGFVLPNDYPQKFPALAGWLEELGWRFEFLPYFRGMKEIAALLVLLVIAWFMPNTQEIMDRYRPALGVRPAPAPQRFRWRMTPTYAVLIAIVAIAGIFSLGSVSEFLYFQF